MTIASNAPRIAGPFAGNAIATAFPFAFKTYLATDISVTLLTLASGAQQVLVLNDPNGYSVNLNADQNNNPGGVVTYNPSVGGPMPATQTLTIAGDQMPDTQTTTLVLGGNFNPVNIMDMVDRAMIAAMQVRDRNARTLQFPVVDGSAPNVVFPPIAQRANMFAAFDGAGNAIASPGVGTTPVSAAMAPVVSALTTLLGLAALGIQALQIAFLTTAGALSAFIAPLLGSADGITFANSLGVNNGGLGKNMVINGNMVIDQRNAGAAVTPTLNAYTVDRWELGTSQSSKLTVQQVVDAPPGFKFSTKITVAAQYAPLAGDVFQFIQPIEGNNIVRLGWGAANGKQASLGFWVKASVGGVYSGAIISGGLDRSYVFQTPNLVANTWTFIPIQAIPNIATGTFPQTNSVGLSIIFDLGSGANQETVAGVWQNGNLSRVAGNVKFVNQVNGSTLQFTGVQYEKGAYCTAFEDEDYGNTLRKSQRYFWKTFPQTTAPAQNTANITGSYLFPVTKAGIATQRLGTYTYPATMRAIPTITSYNPNVANAQIRNVDTGADTSGIGFISISDTSLTPSCTADAGATVGNALTVHLTGSAEL